LSVPDVFQNATLQRLAKVIEERRSAESQPPVVIELRAGRVEPVIYFIHAGPAEIGLARKVCTGQPVFGVAPAMPSTWCEAAVNLDVRALPTMAELAAPFAAAIGSHARSVRVALAGYSFGGMIAFNVAQQLREQGLDVQDVILFDTWPAPAKEIAWSNLWPDLRIAFKALLAARPTGSFAVAWQIAWTLIEEALHPEMRRIVKRKKLRSNPAVDESNPSHVRDEDGTPLGWPLLKTIYTHARRTYSPRPLNCRGIFFRAAPEGDAHQVAHARDDSLGWRKLFIKGVKIVPVPGGHIGMVSDRSHDDALCQAIALGLTSSILDGGPESPGTPATSIVSVGDAP
jgi:thioesterase domain-containing protein